MQTMTISFAALAQRYATLGYRLFPCAPGAKTPLTAHGLRDATDDPDQIERWWSATPCANVGLSTQGLLVVDIDGPKNPWLADDQERLLSLSEAPLSLTPRGGSHRLFRQPAGRDWRNTAGRLAPHVDTRANGGYIVAPPSVVDNKSYRWALRNELDVPPEQLPAPPDWLIAALDRLANGSANSAANGRLEANPIPSGQRNATLARLAGAMRRVGMSQGEIAAALRQANADRCDPPLPPVEVERIAVSVARYEPDQVATAVVENHWGQMVGHEVEPAVEEPAAVADPGPIPESLLRVPGFIGEVMDYCLATAPYPNPVMAFGGALALQAFLAARKVRDPGDNRTNLYLLGLAHSAAGKDWPRKINARILHEIGLAHCIGERFASGEGIQDAMLLSPSMLFQTDEIDGLLQSINKARDARYENIMGTLLTMHSTASSVYPMRRKAGRESPAAIDQPSLVIFGTAIPNHYFEALSERMLTNGFFARMIILECGRRGPGQEPAIAEIPDRVLEIARWWNDYRPGQGNLQDWHPTPSVVPQTNGAKQILIDARIEAEAEYEQAENNNNAVGTTVWGRVSEHSRKLALLYAISQDAKNPEIDRDAAAWAAAFVTHQARRMLCMAGRHASRNDFDAMSKELLRVLRAWSERHGDRPMPEWELARRLPWKPSDHDDVIKLLRKQKLVDCGLSPSKTKSGMVYWLASR